MSPSEDAGPKDGRDPDGETETEDGAGDEDGASQRPDVGGGGRIPELVAREHDLIEEAEPAAGEGCNTRAVGSQPVREIPEPDEDDDADEAEDDRD